MPDLVAFLLIFVALGVFFVFIHLVLGSLIRPRTPRTQDPEKFTIYECGEPTIGSAWIQFDLRFYVIALLFVIFDVEVAFFFPWAVVFGKASALANKDLPLDRRAQLTVELETAYRPESAPLEIQPPEQARAAQHFAWIAFVDILVFFGVLLVGFAYLWKRGDLHWVRSLAAERTGQPSESRMEEPALVGAGSHVG